MRTRVMVSAFLTYDGKVLLIHRGMHKKIAPGMWSCIGGHMEPDELNDPIKTCYREVEEETGIKKEQIENLRLKYITTRVAGDEIRMGYYFYGNIKYLSDLPYCDEGDYHWISFSEAAEKTMSFSVGKITKHLLSNLTDENVYLCGINRENDSMTWVKL